MSAIHFALITLAVCCASNAAAQNTNWYYDQSTRYGTFRHYSNGGSKLISGTDYAAQIATSQQEARQMTAERQKQRQIELERMRAAQYPASRTNQGSQPKNYGPTPADLARREREEQDAFYRKYEALLENAKDLSSQAIVLRTMQEMRPSDNTALRLFGVYAQLAEIDLMRDIEKSFSPAFLAANMDAIQAGYGSALFRLASYKNALFSLDHLESPDLSSFAQSLCSHIRLRNWDQIKPLFTKHSSSFPELLPVATDLVNAFTVLENGQSGTSGAKIIADALLRFAIARRESKLMDFVNILALDTAVELDPENSTYREERFNSNSILKLKHAMEADYIFFNK